MTLRDTLVREDDPHRQFDELGVARVRALLRGQDGNTGWRREAEQWLDERLRREGERTYAAVLASIGLLGLVIVALAWLWW